MQLRLALAAAVAAALAGTAAQAAPVSATASANANILAANQVTATRDLDFGSIARPTTGSTLVTVASAATGTATPALSGGNAFVPTSGQARAATFHLVGTPGLTYSIQSNTLSFPGAGTNLGTPGPESPAAEAGTTLGTLPSSGTPGQQDLYVGGHFTIDANTAVQSYTGALVLTVNFN